MNRIAGGILVSLDIPAEAQTIESSGLISVISARGPEKPEYIPAQSNVNASLLIFKIHTLQVFTLAFFTACTVIIYGGRSAFLYLSVSPRQQGFARPVPAVRVKPHCRRGYIAAGPCKGCY
jgi:hypothetical protein